MNEPTQSEKDIQLAKSVEENLRLRAENSEWQTATARLTEPDSRICVEQILLIRELKEGLNNLHTENERLLAMWNRNERLVSERERNLQFCVCTFSDDGDVETLCEAHRDAAAELACGLEAEKEKLRDAREELQDWLTSYPLEIFPEPDFPRAAELLEAGGITLDAISASNMRHVITLALKLTDRALEAKTMNGLHGRIMNLSPGKARGVQYKLGHSRARHDAAELVVEVEAENEKLISRIEVLCGIIVRAPCPRFAPFAEGMCSDCDCWKSEALGEKP